MEQHTDDEKEPGKQKKVADSHFFSQNSAKNVENRKKFWRHDCLST